MSSKLLATLNHFSDLANKSTGCNHTLDQERFFDFIIQAHHENSSLDESKLRELLIDQGWSEDYADKLSSKYYFSRDLLKQYDS